MFFLSSQYLFLFMLCPSSISVWDVLDQGLILFLCSFCWDLSESRSKQTQPLHDHFRPHMDAWSLGLYFNFVIQSGFGCTIVWLIYLSIRRCIAVHCTKSMQQSQRNIFCITPKTIGRMNAVALWLFSDRGTNTAPSFISLRSFYAVSGAMRHCHSGTAVAEGFSNIHKKLKFFVATQC